MSNTWEGGGIVKIKETTNNKKYFFIKISLFYFPGYNSDIDPRVANGFATAAMRFGHTLIQPEFERRDSSNKKSYSPVLLRNVSAALCSSCIFFDLFS